jgi:hypothetical protein
MTRSVSSKMGVRAGSRACFINAPADAVAAMELPELDVSDVLDGDFDYIHLFCVTREEMERTFPALKEHLRPSGTAWLSWPRGRALGSDLVLPTVIEVGYRHGLVESTCLRVDDTWSALKFTHPKPGKTYHNSYGTLPGA